MLAVTVDDVPDWIVDRVRTPPPADCSVVPLSTPVVCFGDQQAASVATLGINPSWRQFADDDGHLLTGDRERLTALSDFGVSDPRDLSRDDVAEIVLACTDYFDHAPYWRWFAPLEALLTGVGASYLDRSACHLDLVQWATLPVWSKLSDDVRARLLDADAAFLGRQLRHDGIRLVLVNGVSAVRHAAAVGVEWSEPEPVHARGKSSSLWQADEDGVRFIGWSANLPHHACAQVLRDAVGARVAELVGEELSTVEGARG